MGKIGDADGICALVKGQLDKSGFADLLKIGFIADGMEQSRFDDASVGVPFIFVTATGSEHALREQSIAAESSRADILAVILFFLFLIAITRSPIFIKSPLCVELFI